MYNRLSWRQSTANDRARGVVYEINTLPSLRRSDTVFMYYAMWCGWNQLIACERSGVTPPPFPSRHA